MRLYDIASKDCYYNLAAEEVLFNRMPEGEECLMLWQNDPCVVVGKYQNTLEEISPRIVSEYDIKVVRRLSGGGAVFHDQGNLNYSFILNRERGQIFDFRTFAVPVIDALKHFGVDACFSGRNDLLIDGKKFCGNSQYANGSRLVHHGCIMLDCNTDMISKVLVPPSSKIQSKGIKSVRSRVCGINDYASPAISMHQLKESIIAEIRKANVLEECALSAEETNLATELANDKYSQYWWNYGESPEYTVKKSSRYPFGSVSAIIKISKGTIKRIKFYGDFFGDEDISILEKQMNGLLYCDNIKEEIIKAGIDNINNYINGMSDSDFCDFMMPE